MLISMKKRADGAGVLRVVREDGSESWQKISDRHAAYFALHDLTHYAVETAMGYKRGFFGLLREGWEFNDTTGKGARGPLPPEAVEVECLVGMFFSERASHSIWTAEEFSQATNLGLTEEILAKIRKRRSELYKQWEAVPAGQTLELKFE